MGRDAFVLVDAEMLVVARARATVLDVRRANRSAVLRPLLLGGPLNRVALARLTGLSSGSVTNVTSALLAEGLIVEVGREDSDGGRPSVLLEVNPQFGAVIGVDVGETGIRVGAFDLRMREIASGAVSIHPQHHGAEEVIERIVAAIQELKLELVDGGHRLVGVGVALPGVVEQDGEAYAHAPNIGWDAVPVTRLLCERVRVPVFAENGAKTLGQAEMWIGAGRGVDHAVVTLWGSGVGAAIFANGVLYRGVGSSAGEWGHTCISVGGRRCRCGASGCLEAYIGALPLLAEWQRIDAAAPKPTDPDTEEWVDQLLVQAAASPAAAELLEQTAVHFGAAAANLANLFNPERIIIGGWLGLKLGPALIERVREVVSQQALAYPAARVTIELGQLGPDAVALGASTLVVEQMLASGGATPTLA